MKSLPPSSRSLRIVLSALAAGTLAAAAQAAAGQDASLRSVEKFLQEQTAGLPGKVGISVKVGQPGSAPLPACEQPEAFLPQGATPWGRLSVGVRCRAERPWTRYVQAHVAVEGPYYVAAHALDAGRPLGAGDVTERVGDLTRLPRSVITDAAALEGVVTANRIAPGAPLRRELLRGVVVIRQGQTVKLVAQGPGFTVSSEGKALTQAEIGAVAQAKTPEGRLVRGVADRDGQIRLVN